MSEHNNAKSKECLNCNIILKLQGRYFPNLRKNIMKQYLKSFSFFVFIVSVCFLPYLSNAQAPANPLGDPDVPIDGGVSILIAAGVAYGIKKVRDERKKNIIK